MSDEINEVNYNLVRIDTGEGLDEVVRALCLPAAIKVGSALDQLADVAISNVKRTFNWAKRKNPEMGQSETVHPRLLLELVQKAAFVDDEVLSEAWAGLLASSATEDASDLGNLKYTNILSQLTPTQARIVRFVYEDERFKRAFHWEAGRKLLIETINTQFETGVLAQACGEHRPEELNAELVCLKQFDLVSGYFYSTSWDVVGLSPTRFGTMFYIRCQGSRKSMYDYFHGDA